MKSEKKVTVIYEPYDSAFYGKVGQSQVYTETMQMEKFGAALLLGKFIFNFDLDDKKVFVEIDGSCFEYIECGNFITNIFIGTSIVDVTVHGILAGKDKYRFTGFKDDIHLDFYYDYYDFTDGETPDRTFKPNEIEYKL